MQLAAEKDLRKYHLVEWITKLDNEQTISNIENYVFRILHRTTPLNKLTVPIRQKLDINELIAEQNFHGVDLKRFRQLIDEMNIQDPIELLIEQSK